MQRVIYIIPTTPVNKILLLVWVFTMLSLALRTQATPVTHHSNSPSTIQNWPDLSADLALYYSQIENNVHKQNTERTYQLWKTASIDTLISAYIERGLAGVAYDSISLPAIFRSDILTQEKREFLKELYQIAPQYKNKQLNILLDSFKAFLLNNREAYESKMEEFEEVIRKAREINNIHLEAYILTEMWFSSYYSERYARSFLYAQRLSDVLDEIDDNYPYKGMQYIWLGVAYYKFKDYEKSVYYLQKGLIYRNLNHAHIAGNYFRAWNHLASYHQMTGNPDSAAYYLRTLLSSPECVLNLPAHTNFAICNLGRIEQEKGSYDAAIAMMEAGLKHMAGDHNDLEFIAGVHASLAECYLEKGNLRQVRFHLDEGWKTLIPDFYETDKFNRSRALYAVESKYYSRLGQTGEAALYLDSALLATSHYEKITGQHLILLGEQELQEAEMQLKNLEIARHKNRNLFIWIIFLITFVSMLVVTNLYRKKRQAYQVLAKKAKEWARSVEIAPPVKQETPKTSLPCEEDIRLAEQLHQFMLIHKPYRDMNLTLESLSAMLDISRHKLSHAINQTRKQNFNHYINEFRVKETIRLMADPQSQKLSLEELMEQAGFSSRTAFYQAFKKSTGLTPAQYRKNSL